MTPEAIAIACLLQGVDPNTFEYHKAAAATAHDPEEPTYGAMQKMAANFARNLYVAAGKGDSLEAVVFEKLSHVETWFPELDKYTDRVLAAMTRELGAAITEQNDLEQQHKQAGIPGFLLGLLGRGAAAAPDLTKTLMGGGAAMGAGLGAIGWGLNRHSTEDDLKTEAMKEKLRHYRRITSEISEDLNSNNALENPERPTKVIQDDAHTPYVV